MTEVAQPKFGQALALVIVLIGIFSGGIIGLGVGAHVPLLFSLVVVTFFCEVSWR